VINKAQDAAPGPTDALHGGFPRSGGRQSPGARELPDSTDPTRSAGKSHSPTSGLRIHFVLSNSYLM